MLAAFLICLVQYFSSYKASTSANQIAAAIGYVGGILCWLYWLSREFDRYCWTLTDSELIGGKHGDKRFPLSTIRRIVPGLPEQFHPLTTLIKYTNHTLWENAVVSRRLSLLLQFADGRMLPLNLHACLGGTDIMTQLVNQCPAKVDSGDKYTPEEIKVLKNVDWNRIAKKRGPQRIG
jgi:hypothetical protein